MMKTSIKCAVVAVLGATLAACAAGSMSTGGGDSAEFHPAPKNSFEEAFAKEPGARPIRWGGWMQTITPGGGESPTADDKVKVHYRGTLTDGTEFDSSYKRGQPAVFPLANVIPCWTNGVMMMKVGEKAKFVCPSAVAYGDAGSPPHIPGGATLVFDIELLGIAH
jgi:FKBP-type peptidyl-prolyl cis-trans isomerase FkpA